MLHIFLATLPFFALIALGYGAAKTAIFSKDATVHLTKFVFYFALSAMLFKFSSNLSLREILEWDFMAAYLIGSIALYVMTVADCKAQGNLIRYLGDRSTMLSNWKHGLDGSGNDTHFAG